MSAPQMHMALAPQYGLTSRERECLDVIQAHIARYRSSPSYDDIAIGLGLSSKSSIHRLVTGLEKRGHIVRQFGSKRSIALVAAPAAPLPGYTLPSTVEVALRAHCRKSGDDPADVIVDAVALFLDDAGQRVASA